MIIHVPCYYLLPLPRIPYLQPIGLDTKEETWTSFQNDGARVIADDGVDDSPLGRFVSASFEGFLSLLIALSDDGKGRQEKKLRAERFSFLAMIRTEENWPIQTDVPKEFQQETLSLENEEAYIHYMRRQAKWLEPKFRALLVSIVDDLNACAKKCEAAGQYADQSKHIAALGVDPEKYDLRISSAFNVQRSQEQGTGICGIKFAPLKEFERCLAKAVSFHGESWLAYKPAARYLCDVMRATIYAQDPYVISLAFAMFKNRCEGCPRVSNYFVGHEHIPQEAQTFINTTFRVIDPDTKTEHFAELQFALQDFLTIKGIQHEFYEVSRAATDDELLARPLGEDH